MATPKRRRYPPPPRDPEPDTTSDLDRLRVERDKLDQRLADGYQKIDQGILQGNDVAAWEQFWYSLLAEYEAICDEIVKVRR
jgi:hypothetical protein